MQSFCNMLGIRTQLYERYIMSNCWPFGLDWNLYTKFIDMMHVMRLRFLAMTIISSNAEYEEIRGSRRLALKNSNGMHSVNYYRFRFM